MDGWDLILLCILYCMSVCLSLCPCLCVKSAVFHVIQQIMLFKWHIRLEWVSVMCCDLWSIDACAGAPQPLSLGCCSRRRRLLAGVAPLLLMMLYHSFCSFFIVNGEKSVWLEYCLIVRLKRMNCRRICRYLGVGGFTPIYLVIYGGGFGFWYERNCHGKSLWEVKRIFAHSALARVPIRRKIEWKESKEVLVNTSFLPLQQTTVSINPTVSRYESFSVVDRNKRRVRRKVEPGRTQDRQKCINFHFYEYYICLNSKKTWK